MSHFQVQLAVTLSQLTHGPVGSVAQVVQVEFNAASALLKKNREKMIKKKNPRTFNCNITYHVLMWGVCPESPEDIESSTFKSFLFLAAAAEYNLVIHQLEAKRKCWQQMDIVFAKKKCINTTKKSCSGSIWCWFGARKRSKIGRQQEGLLWCPCGAKLQHSEVKWRMYENEMFAKEMQLRRWISTGRLLTFSAKLLTWR